jgi:hypothetical protein
MIMVEGGLLRTFPAKQDRKGQKHEIMWNDLVLPFLKIKDFMNSKSSNISMLVFVQMYCFSSLSLLYLAILKDYNI